MRQLPKTMGHNGVALSRLWKQQMVSNYWRTKIRSCWGGQNILMLCSTITPLQTTPLWMSYMSTPLQSPPFTISVSHWPLWRFLQLSAQYQLYPKLSISSASSILGWWFKRPLENRSPHSFLCTQDYGKGVCWRITQFLYKEHGAQCWCRFCIGWKSLRLDDYGTVAHSPQNLQAILAAAVKAHRGTICQHHQDWSWLPVEFLYFTHPACLHHQPSTTDNNPLLQKSW